MRKLRLTTTFLVCLLASAVIAQDKQVHTGNKLYQEKKYKEAAAAYEQALKKNPTFTPGLFNLGNALYQQKNFEASRKVMDATAKQAKDKNVKGNASYNIGNSYMTEQKWQEAVDAYKTALRNNPQDEAAKYNLSYALAMMKKNQGGKDKKQEKKEEKEKDKEENKDQNGEKKEEEKKEDPGKEEKKNEEQSGKEENKDQQDQRPQSQPSKLSKEQAEQLLNALAQEEKKLHDKKEKGKAVKVKVDKDW